MGWTQVWLGSAKRRRLALPLEEQAEICRAIEEFARDATGNDPPGHLRAGEWWIGIAFEKDATYRSDDGEDVEGDVVWVHRLFIPDPDGDDDLVARDDDA